MAKQKNGVAAVAVTFLVATGAVFVQIDLHDIGWTRAEDWARLLQQDAYRLVFRDASSIESGRGKTTFSMRRSGAGKPGKPGESTNGPVAAGDDTEVGITVPTAACWDAIEAVRKAKATESAKPGSKGGRGVVEKGA